MSTPATYLKVSSLIEIALVSSNGGMDGRGLVFFAAGIAVVVVEHISKRKQFLELSRVSLSSILSVDSRDLNVML